MVGTVAPQSEPVKPSEMANLRGQLSRGFKQLVSLVNAAEKPLPTETGDGTYLKDEKDHHEVIDKIGSGLETLSRLRLLGIETLAQVQEKQMTGSLCNDKE